MGIGTVLFSLPKAVLGTLKSAKGQTRNAGSTFTALEEKLMAECFQYTKAHGVETSRVVNRKGKVLDLKVNESPINTSVESKTGITIFGQDSGKGKSLKLMLDARGGHLVHSHPADTPLSITDVQYLMSSSFKRITAKTPNGYFSSMTKPRNPLYHRIKAFIDINLMKWNNWEEATKLGLVDFGDDFKPISRLAEAKPEVMRQYQGFSIKQLQEFAKKYHFVFEHNFTT